MWRLKSESFGSCRMEEEEEGNRRDRVLEPESKYGGMSHLCCVPWLAER